MNGGGGPPEFVVVSSVEITAAAVKDDEVKQRERKWSFVVIAAQDLFTAELTVLPTQTTRTKGLMLALQYNLGPCHLVQSTIVHYTKYLIV